MAAAPGRVIMIGAGDRAQAFEAKANDPERQSGPLREYQVADAEGAVTASMAAGTVSHATHRIRSKRSGVTPGTRGRVSRLRFAR